jgi:hypothetical protein
MRNTAEIKHRLLPKFLFLFWSFHLYDTSIFSSAFLRKCPKKRFGWNGSTVLMTVLWNFRGLTKHHYGHACKGVRIFRFFFSAL